METLTITLAPEIKEFVEEQAIREGSTLNEYLGELLRERRDRDRREIREKLLEAVRSGPATPMTRQDWDDIRRDIWARRASPDCDFCFEPSRMH